MGTKGCHCHWCHWSIRLRWFHTFCPCAEPLGDGHEGMWARFGSQGSIALNWHSRYSGMRYSGTWLYIFKYLFQRNLKPLRKGRKNYPSRIRQCKYGCNEDLQLDLFVSACNITHCYIKHNNHSYGMQVWLWTHKYKSSFMFRKINSVKQGLDFPCQVVLKTKNSDYSWVLL